MPAAVPVGTTALRVGWRGRVARRHDDLIVAP